MRCEGIAFHTRIKYSIGMLKKFSTLVSVFIMLACSLPSDAANASSLFKASTVPQVPTSFDNLYQNRHGIAFGTWSKIQAAIHSSNKELPPVHSFQGPNTKRIDKSSLNDLKVVYGIFPDKTFVKNIDLIYFNKSDIDWATNKATSLMGPQEVEKQVAYKGPNQQALQAAINQPDDKSTPVMGQSCSKANQWSQFNGIYYVCRKDNSPINVWEAVCGNPGEIGNFSGVSVVCVGLGISFPGDTQARSIWEMPKSMQTSPSPQPQPTGPPPASPLIFCPMDDPMGCASSDSWVGADGTLYLGIGIANKPYPSTDVSYKLTAVELYHALWLSNYVKNRSLLPQTPEEASKNLTQPNLPPYWFISGGETYGYLMTQTAANSQTLGKAISSPLADAIDYFLKTNRSNIAKEFGKPFNLTWLNNFLDIKNSNTTWREVNTMNDLGFTLGIRIIQILIALKGPSVVFDIPNLMSQGQTFDQAFQSIYGVTWTAAEPAMAKTIWDEYQNHY